MKLSISMQSGLRWVVIVLALFALKANSSSAVQWGLGGFVAVLFVSAFFWPRCPHCGARVVQFNKREWIAGETCWRCHRPYDEERTPAYLVDFTGALEEAYKLRKKDPAESERLMTEAGKRLEAAHEAEKGALRERARIDPVAARTLKNRLQGELEGLKTMRQHLRKGSDNDPTYQAGLDYIETRTLALQHEIASIDAMPPLFSAMRKPE